MDAGKNTEPLTMTIEMTPTDFETEAEFLEALHGLSSDLDHPPSWIDVIIQSRFFNETHYDFVMSRNSITIVLSFIISDHFTLEIFDKYYYDDSGNLHDDVKDSAKKWMLEILQDFL